jgi:hypothetical protein
MVQLEIEPHDVHEAGEIDHRSVKVLLRWHRGGSIEGVVRAFR